MAYFRTGTNNFGTAKLIVDANPGQGTHTTIASALTDANSGDTIFIRPGTYSENLTLKSGVNLTAYNCDAITGSVKIVGKATMSATGTCNISGIRLQTNSDFFLVVSGANTSIVNLFNCYLSVSNGTAGISFTSSNAASKINIYNSLGDIASSGVALFANSAAGVCQIFNCLFTNSGGSSTANTVSAGSLAIFNSVFFNPITTSGTSTFGMTQSGLDTSAQNVTCLTTGGSGNHTVNHNSFTSGTASAISVGNATNIAQSYVNSTNSTAAITGAGTLTYQCISFTNSSKKINTTTQVGGVFVGGLTQAPSAGFIGEQLTGSATGVATTSTVSKSITSVTLTPGIWDLSGSSISLAVGGGGNVTNISAGISSVDNTLPSAPNLFQFNNSICLLMSSCISGIRVVVTSNTTYYYVVQNIYSSTTCPTDARIVATRVG